MCHACVIDSVKRTMLSRRSLFTGAAALTAAASLAPRAALAEAGGKVVDLTHTFSPDFPTFDGNPGLVMDADKTIAKDGYQIWKLTIWEHSGTHIDAPLHFSADGTSVDELPPDRLVCPLRVIRIADKAKEDANAVVEVADIEAHVSQNGVIPKGALVAMDSGWAAKIGTPAYRGEGVLAFPGFSKAATDALAEMGVVAIGVDTLSLDPGNSADFAVHHSWLPGGRYGIENLAALDQLPDSGATIVVGAPKHKGGTGGPARVLALL